MPIRAAMGEAPADRPEKRRFPRHAFRIPCTFRVGGDEGRGFVTDVSAGGLFLQTVTRVEPGLEVLLTLELHEGPPLQLHGVVARTRVGHRSAATVLRPGFGVHLDAAPEAWFQLVLSLCQRD